MSTDEKNKMASDNSKRKSAGRKVSATISEKVGSYEKHPFFIKKLNKAKELLSKVGLPATSKVPNN